jgi:4-hydroxy-tetrahydrodipicolinate synthase
MTHPLAGIYAAALTPLDPAGDFDPDGLRTLLQFLADRGCHGALILGTTGEGPSFSLEERARILRAAAHIREALPGFRLVAGVGTPSQGDTGALMRLAFDLGYDAALVLPPYYFRNAPLDGLYGWFAGLLERDAPRDGIILGYHIPPVTGVPLPLELLDKLRDAFPRNFHGIKDSSADPAFAEQAGRMFGDDLLILNGTDRLLTRALGWGAQGAITALANIVSPDLRAVWDAHRQGSRDIAAQSRLDAARSVLEKYPPAPALLKTLLSEFHEFPRWSLKPPLLPLDEPTARRARLAWQARGKMA